ncbi:MAG: hypothetical protein QW814_01805 [Methanothrix sp.]
MDEINNLKKNQNTDISNNNSNNIIHGKESNGITKMAAKIVLAAIIVAIILAIIYATVRPESNVSKTTFPTTTTPKNSSSIVHHFKTPESYLEANTFSNDYNFSSPLDYRFTALFQPTTATGNCTGLEGIVGYMQNETMISKPYNLSSLSHSKPIAEYASVLGINPPNLQQYNALFDANGGYCSQEFAASLHNSTYSVLKYKYDNVTVYLFSMSNLTKQAMGVFGSYIGPKPNMTIYLGSALYGSYRIKVLAARFSNAPNSLALESFAKNLTNATIKYVESSLITNATAN